MAIGKARILPPPTPRGLSDAIGLLQVLANAKELENKVSALKNWSDEASKLYEGIKSAEDAQKYADDVKYKAEKELERVHDLKNELIEDGKRGEQRIKDKEAKYAELEAALARARQEVQTREAEVVQEKESLASSWVTFKEETAKLAQRKKELDEKDNALTAKEAKLNAAFKALT